MRNNSIKNRLNSVRVNNQGTTFVEMIVCFALLAIFLACAAALISNITMIYYNIKGEIYSREVSDIVMEKIVSEVDGAEYFRPTSTSVGTNPKVSTDHKSIDLFDKTDTSVSVSAKNNKLVIHYYPIVYKVNGADDDILSREATDWYFDDSVYNGFEISELSFYQGGATASSPSSNEAKKYGLSGLDMSNYGSNIILVLLKMDSERYGEFYFYRFVKMYNIPYSTSAPAPPGG